ncbi:hypothetical protein CRUP_002196 [Coryphaenoides rupestris]|nr:hypothetical protein CRUP_002196 [Coryphaenoides rupestris]
MPHHPQQRDEEPSGLQGYCASLQDRFLVMAAEMEHAGTQDLAQFWKEVSKGTIMEHRLGCHVQETLKPALSPLGDGPAETGANEQPDVNTTKLDSCLWLQKVLVGVLVLLVALLAAQRVYLDPAGLAGEPCHCSGPPPPPPEMLHST